MCQRTCHLLTRKWNERKLKKIAQKTEGGVVEILLVYLQLSKKNIENKQLKSNIFTLPDHHTKNHRQHSFSCFQHLLLAKSHITPQLLYSCPVTLTQDRARDCSAAPRQGDADWGICTQPARNPLLQRQGTKLQFSQRQKNTHNKARSANEVTCC